MQTPIILSDTQYDKWLNSLKLVLPSGDLRPYYWLGLKWLINYLTHASKKHGQPWAPWLFGISSCFAKYRIFICFIFTWQCSIVRVMLIMRSHIVAKEDKSLLHTNRRLCHHSSDYRALDGIWREFISGVISFLKANEFPDNKMVG